MKFICFVIILISYLHQIEKSVSQSYGILISVKGEYMYIGVNKMSKFFKGIILGTVILALAGCGVQQAEEQSTVENTTESSENVEVEDEKITLQNITPEQLQNFTGFEADYKAYMEGNSTSIRYLKNADDEYIYEKTIYVYPSTGEDSSALYIYESSGEIIDAKIDEFVGSISTEGEDADYVFYTYSSMLEKQPTEESLGYNGEQRLAFETDLKDNFIGQPLYKLHEKLEIYVPVYSYEKIGETKKLNTYMIVSEVGYTASTDVNVIYNEEGTILDIYLDDTYGPGKKDPLKVLDSN